MLGVRDIYLSYETSVLSRISFSIRNKEIYGIVGESGAGKSSLLNIIAGFTDPDEGEIFLDGHRLPYASQQLVPGRKQIALVPQDFQLDHYHTVEENIREAILSVPEPHRQKKVNQVLSWMHLTKHAKKQARYLSGGEKQRLAIARAIATDPIWLLLDEPFSHLDFTRKNLLIKYIKEIPFMHGTGVIVVSHEAQDLMALCGKIAILSRGKLSVFKKVPQVYFSLKNLSMARLMGWVNELHFHGKFYRFRPNQFILDKNGVPLEQVSVFFNGLAYIHEYKSSSNDRIVLYAQDILNKLINIKVMGNEL